MIFFFVKLMKYTFGLSAISMSSKGQVVISIRNNWRSAFEQVEEAFYDFMKNHRGTMYSMGMDSRRFHTNKGKDKRGKEYTFKIDNQNQEEKYYIRLDNGLFYQILAIPPPSLPLNKEYFNEK